MSSAARRPKLLDWKALVGIGLGVGLLIYSLRGISLREVMGEIRQADTTLFLISIVLAACPVLVRAWRWRALLEPVRPGTSFSARFRATMIGFMANNVLPARIGEVARAYALRRMEPVPVVASVGSLVVERLLDGIVVIAFLFLAMALPGFPGSETGNAFGSQAGTISIVIGAVALAALMMVVFPRAVMAVVRHGIARVLPIRAREPVITAAESLLAGLGSLRHPRLLARAGFWSIGVWLVNTLAFWIGFRAFGIETPFASALFLQSVIALAVALPSAPGFFGLWETAARIGLHDVYGVELNKALGFAVGFHIGSFLTVTIPGLFFAWKIGLSLGDVGKAEKAETTPTTDGQIQAEPNQL